MVRKAADFRAIARDKLRGHWGIPILVCFVAALLGASNQSMVDISTTVSQGFGSVEYSLPWMFGWMAIFPRLLTRVLPPLALILSIISLICGGAAELGECRYFTRLCRNEEASFNTLFDRFNILLRALGLRLFMGLFIFLWGLLLVVPGVVASYRYALAPYLMADDPDMGIREAVNRSKELMDGHKGRLFCLHLSFFGWLLLCAVSFGILTLWIGPYMQAAIAAFYLERSGQPIFEPTTCSDFQGPSPDGPEGI